MNSKLEIRILGPFPHPIGLTFDRALLKEGDVLTVLAPVPGDDPNVWRVLWDSAAEG